ncbi:MAG: hypothetical protein DDT39_01608 [Firmicutes bacterium]|nr:hypothetical protein [candidate division NPL-UPA2 bacterium]
MLEPWNAAALPEIMAGALQESKRCGIAGQWADRGGAGQQLGGAAGKARGREAPKGHTIVRDATVSHRMKQA